MKRKLLFLASLLSASMVLTACGGLGEGGEGGEGGGGSGIKLPNTAEEAVNKFYQFANSTGFEITYKTYDDESAQPEVNTVGFKNNTFWVKEEVAYKKDGNKLEMYEYDADKGTYEFQAAVNETEQASLDAMLKSFTAVFYAGYDYASQPVGSFTSKTDVTFLGRAASEYTFTYLAGTASATLKIVFDNATGITLKIYGSASDSTGSSSAEFEVTSFTFGEAVRVPTLNKSSGQGGEGGGGEGGGGGQQDVDYFSNKLLVYVSHQSANMYVNSTLALFDDGKFELSFYDGGYLVVKLGEYSVGANKVSATLNVKKVYKDRDQKYSAMNETLTLNYADGGYALQVSTSGKVNYIASGQSPVHADIPEEDGGQSGEDAKYRVTETQWNNMIVNRGLISLTSNFTMVTTNSGNQEKYEFDNGKVHYTSAINEVFYEFTSLTSGYVYYKSNGQWQKGAADGMHQLFDDYIGVLPVPYSKVSFNSDSHYYGCSQWTTVGADGQQDSYQNARFYFENSNLMKTSYKHWNVDYLYNYSKHGQTSVTLPQTGGQTDTNARYKITSAIWEDMILDAGLVSLTSNFTAMVRASDLPQGQQNKYEFDNGKIHCIAADGYEYYQEFTSQSGGYTYSKNESGVWTKSNNTFGISSYMNSLGMLPLEFSQLTFNESTHEYELATYNDPYGGGVYASNIAISFVDNKLMKMSYTKDGIYHETEFAKYGQTSVTLPEVGGGGQQQQSKWPAEDIATKLTQIGVNVTLPAPNIDDENIDGVNAVVPEDNSELRITITLSNSSTLRVVLYQYLTGVSGFSVDYSSSNPNNGFYGLLNEAKDTSIKLLFDPEFASPVLTIVISKFNGNPYPTDEIAAFFRENNLTNPLPSLDMNNVSYTFVNQADITYLLMQPMNGSTIDAIKNSVASTLCNNGFKTVYVPNGSEEGGLLTLFIDPAIEYSISIEAFEDGNVYVFISLGGEEMAASVDFDYPQEKINALTPEDITDTLPTLAVSGAVYMLGEDGNGFQLQISLQPSGIAAERALSNLQTVITRSEYTLNEEDNGYHSANDQIVIYLNNVLDKIIEIQVRFAGEEPPVEPQEVAYTLICTNDWDITQADAQLYAYVWDDKGNFEWIALQPNGEGTFILETHDNWIGMKVVRFSPDSEIGWRNGPDGSVNENVTIWNETEDMELDGKGGYIEFFLLG